MLMTDLSREGFGRPPLVTPSSFPSPGFFRSAENSMFAGPAGHGQKMQQTAQKEGLSPLELATRNSQVFRDLWAALGRDSVAMIATDHSPSPPARTPVTRPS